MSENLGYSCVKNSYGNWECRTTRVVPGHPGVDLTVLTARRFTGKRYVVTKYEPPWEDETFIWPAYVTVIGDHGHAVTGHTHRFRDLTPEEAETNFKKGS